MLYRKILLLTLPFVLLCWQQSHAQVVLSNHGALISVKNKALLSIRGDVNNSANGQFHNTDTISITGNWTNNAENTAFLRCDSGIVKLYGGEQHIGGSSVTEFTHLLFTGSGIKYGDIDARVWGNLHLTDKEVNYQTHVISVRNESINAVTNNGGFVSSLADGGLERYMSVNEPYFFPVGSSGPAFFYRPVYITPKVKGADHYLVGFTPSDASLDGFDRTDKARWICSINPAFYHRIYHVQTSNEALLSFYYLPSDGTYNEASHWDDPHTWKRMMNASSTSSGGFSVINIPNWTDYSSKAFALSYHGGEFGLAGNDTSIYPGAHVALNSSGASTYQWSPSAGLSCDQCPNPIATPDSSTTYYLSTSRQDGCSGFDSIRINVIQDADHLTIFIPNMITPNGDGANDQWVIRDLLNYPDNSVSILNRWGDVIYEKERYDNSFNGTLWGKELPEGTYYYLVMIKMDGTTKTFNGPLTIVR